MMIDVVTQLSPVLFAVPDTTLLSLSLVLVGILNGGIAVRILRNRAHETATAFCVMLFGGVTWTLAQAVLLVATDATLGIVLNMLTYVGSLFMVAGIAHFTLAYAGFSTGRIWVLYALSGFLSVVVLTNPFHELLFVSRSYAGEFIPVLDSLRPLYWLLAAYYWTLTGSAIGLLVREFRSARGKDIYKRQTGFIAMALLLPLVTNVLRYTGVTEFNYTIWAFSVTGVLVAIALERYQWLDLQPVERDDVIERMREGYLVVDGSGRVVDLNEAARNFLDADSPTGDGIETVFPEAEPLLGTDDQRQLQIGSTVLTATASPIQTSDGRGTLLLLRDITERQRTERRFRALIENVSDVVTIVDEKGEVLYHSPSVEGVLGYESSEIVGRNVIQLIHPDDREEASRRFLELVEGSEKTIRSEYRVMRTDGSWRTFEGSATDMLDDEAVEGVVIVYRDVTERKQRETQLERQNERLERFASVVSHDLRNPLNVASGYLELLKTDIEGCEDELQTIENGLDRMETIIEDVLTMARHGRSVEETEPVVVDEACHTAWQSVATGDATLTVEAVSEILADRTRLLQLFENLFRNALEHNEGSVEVRVGTVSKPGNRDSEVTLYVEDDGRGIPIAERDQVFEFGHTTNTDGTGFGLAIVQDIVEAHGWRIEVTESSAGGARFEIAGIEPVSKDRREST